MEVLRSLFFQALILFSPVLLYSQQKQVIRLKDHGLNPGSGENASPVIRKLLARYAGDRNIRFVLPGGKIDLWPEGAASKELYVSNATEDDTSSKIKHIAFLLEEMQDVEIDGNNTLVVLHGKMVSFGVINSKNITIKDLSFDMARPTMSEMTIRYAGKDSVITDIHPDSKYSISDGKISFFGEGWTTKQYHTIAFDPSSRHMTYSSFKPFQQAAATQLREGQVLFTGSFDTGKYKQGTVLTFRDPYRDNCGAFISGSRDISLRGLNMHYMHGLGIVAQFSENLDYRKIKVAPRENSGRVISSFADCFHFSGCKGKILIDSCHTSGSHDDPINVHGTHLKITGIDNSGKITVRFMHHQTYGFPAFFKGDSIAFVDPQTLREFAKARIETATLKNLREMELSLAGSLPPNLVAGAVIENLTWTPELTIRNSVFELTNTRGILVTTRKKVVIENNEFRRTGMHAILIANDASSWYESGPVRDVTIRKNIFDACGYNSAPGGYAISIAPENHRNLEGFYVHQNVRIENNVFRLSGQPLLGVKSVDGLVVQNNRVEGNFPGGTLIKLDGCNRVRINKNILPGLVSDTIGISNMNRKNLVTDLRTMGR